MTAAHAQNMIISDTITERIIQAHRQSDKLTTIVQEGDSQPYAEIFALMKQQVQSMIDTDTPSPGIVLILEHAPVYTIGKQGNVANLISGELADKLGIDIQHCDRGGDITYHGPGQITAYPLVRLGKRQRHIDEWVARLEHSMALCCLHYGLISNRPHGKRGLFIENRKIGAVGIRIAQGISYHGLALNVQPQMDHFRGIIPCGLKQHPPTSLAQECHTAFKMLEVKKVLASYLESEITAFLHKTA